MKRKGKRIINKYLALFLFLLLIFSAVTGGAFSAWVFGDSINGSANCSPNIFGDRMAYNTVKDLPVEADTAQTYDVYFLAQHIDIMDFLEVDGSNGYRFKNKPKADPSDPDVQYTFADLYYTNPAEGISKYEPRLGNWGTDFSYIPENSQVPTTQLFKKFESVSRLTETQVESLGEPNSKMCDNVSTSSLIWSMKFLSWTPDSIKINYSSFGRPSQNAAPVENQFEAIEGATIYHRDPSWEWLVNSEYIKVYGTYPTENFRIAQLLVLLEHYDDASIVINGNRSLFFYPIYSQAKDYEIASLRKHYEALEDCVRIRDGGDISADKYFTYDCECTELMQDHQSELLKNSTLMWYNSPTLERYTRKFSCFSIKDRLVTAEMQQKNSDAEANTDTKTDPGTVSKPYFGNLTEKQINQIDLGDYIFSDLARNRGAWDGQKVGYILDNNGSLLDVNYREGVYNIYIFQKSIFIDDKPYKSGVSEADLSSRPDDYRDINGPFTSSPFAESYLYFTNEEMAAIDDILLKLNVNVDKAVDCRPYTEFVLNTWGNNNSRDYYVVFEEVVNPVGLAYHTDTNDCSSDVINYADDATKSHAYVSDGGLNFDVDVVTDNRTSTICVDSNDMIITYPSYYIENVIEGKEDETYVQNIGHGPYSGHYAIPKYSYKLSNGVSVTKEFKSDAYLETMAQAVERSDVERERISIQTGGLTYSLSDLRSNNTTLYEKVLNAFASTPLIKVKESGIYRLALYCYKNGDNYEFDIWASMPDGNIVTIYDSSDFGGASLTPDVNGSLFSRDYTIDHYSFISNTSFHDDADLRIGNNLFDTDNRVEFMLSEDKLIPAGMMAYVTQRGGDYFISIDDLLLYYDTIGKCLYDEATGRYITCDNLESYPFIIRGDCLLQVVNKSEFLGE